MDQIGETYYQTAYELFEQQQYEEAVEYFIKAYNLGTYKEEILNNLYSCFVTPNEEEFQKSYHLNSKEIVQIPYEELTIDFIPVSDSKFYLFHRPSQEFMGSFQLDDASIMKKDVEFESILIADSWDFRKILPIMKEKTWEVVYILLNEKKACFASFFKLPRFRELYMENAIVFENIDVMRMFFEEYSDFYLPKQILAKNDVCDSILAQIHKKRISECARKRENVFLSILIPSYNRGNKALEAVREICSAGYDSEIEIIVSDNGSVLYPSEYQAIRDMQDTRVRYYRNDCNMGFLENVMRLLDMAEGEYAILSSDEDVMMVSNLSHYLNLFKKNKACGVFRTSGMFGNFPAPLEEDLQFSGIKAIIKGVNDNYMTGTCYDMSLVRQLKLTEFIRKHKDNVMVEHYPHCVINLKLALTSDVLACGKPPLWFAGDPGEAADGTAPDDISLYMSVDSRERQHIDMIKLYIESGIRNTFLCALYYERCWKFFCLLYVAMFYYPDYYERHHITWEDITKDVVERCKKNMALLEEYTTLEERHRLLDSIDVLYLESKEGKGFKE